jgi:ferrochelatase
VTNNPDTVIKDRQAGQYDAVLLIAFGAPRRSEEVRPFLAELLKGRPIPPSRVEEVVRHYDAIGGGSPFNQRTLEQAAALREKLDRDGPRLPVYVGMRNWTPYVRDVLAEMSQAGIRRAVGLILAPHRSEASFERYQVTVREAQEALGAAAPQVDYVASWHDHPLFIDAVGAQASAAIAQLDAAERSRAQLIFTAHSIPTPMAAASGYVEQVTDSARLVAGAIGHQSWSLAFQSRSGGPRDPWLEPDIGEVLRGLSGRPAVVVPIGFICDHVEVLYDLDIAAAAIARESGVRMVRAATVGSDPRFIAMMADVIRRHISEAHGRG